MINIENLDNWIIIETEFLYVEGYIDGNKINNEFEFIINEENENIPKLIKLKNYNIYYFLDNNNKSSKRFVFMDDTDYKELYNIPDDQNIHKYKTPS